MADRPGSPTTPLKRPLICPRAQPPPQLISQITIRNLELDISDEGIIGNLRPRVSIHVRAKGHPTLSSRELCRVRSSAAPQLS